MRTPRLKPWLVFQWVFAAVVIWFAGRALAGQWDQVASAFRTVRPTWSLIAAATALVLVASAIQIEAWRRLLAVWAAPLSPASAATVWFAANLGKYVPGKVWSIAALSGMAKYHGSSAIAAGASSLLMQVASVATGITIASVTGATGNGGTSAMTVVLLLGALVLFALVAPLIVPRAVRLASRISGRPIGDVRMPPAAILGATLSTAVAWIIVGIAFQLFVRGLMPATHGPTTSYISAYAASAVAGFLALFVPAGIGVRESALIAVMTRLGLASAPDAAVIAVMSRLWLTVLDLVPGLTALVAGRSLRNRESTK